MSLERCDAFPLCRASRSNIYIAVFVIRMLSPIDALCRIDDFLPYANGGVKACRRQCATAGAPGDTPDRPFVRRWDLSQELKDGLDGSARESNVVDGAGMGRKVIGI